MKKTTGLKMKLYFNTATHNFVNFYKRVPDDHLPTSQLLFPSNMLKVFFRGQKKI